MRRDRFRDEHSRIRARAAQATASVPSGVQAHNLCPFRSRHRALQERYLALLRDVSARGDLPHGTLPLLEDRVRTRRGESQLYGTQLRSNASGKLELRSIEDEAGVDARRAAAGLPPLADYLRGFGIDYRPLRRPDGSG